MAALGLGGRQHPRGTRAGLDFGEQHLRQDRGRKHIIGPGVERAQHTVLIHAARQRQQVDSRTMRKPQIAAKRGHLAAICPVEHNHARPLDEHNLGRRCGRYRLHRSVPGRLQRLPQACTQVGIL